MLTVDDARARMLAALQPLAPERVAFAAAAGRMLAADIVAPRSQPPFAASAMDGWAVRSADVASLPAVLRIIGEAAAGLGLAGAIGPGEAARIFTGAPVPTGADLVVIQENAERVGDEVRIRETGRGSNIRAAGSDFAQGETVLKAGRRLDPFALAVAAATGAGSLLAARTPRIGILATGDELVQPGAPAGPDQIYDSVSHALVAWCARHGARAQRLETRGDDADAIAAAVAATRDIDLLVTVGGASVGDHDLVKPALTRLGLEIAVPKIAVKPGKPTWFGALGSGLKVLGLPGNPASALVCARLFLRPILAALEGADPGATVALTPARLGAPLKANGDREEWLRARLSVAPDGARIATAFGAQDSSLQTVLAAADVLIRRLPHAPAVQAGEVVETLVFD
jgi:molybdopterin molybdotransferase